MKATVLTTETPTCCGTEVWLHPKTQRGKCHRCFTYYQIEK